MHPRNKIFFEQVLPDFLNRTRELYLKRSLLVQMDSIKAQEGMVDVPIKIKENGLFERSQTLVSQVDNTTFSATAVQCYTAETEQFNTPYCDDDMIEDEAVKKISAILELPLKDVTLFDIDCKQRVLRVQREEGIHSSYKDLTLVIQEILKFYVDLKKPIVSVEQILYPVDFFGPFRVVADRGKNSATVRVYNQFGTLCTKLLNFRVDGKLENDVENDPRSEGKHISDSPTIRCMSKIGIDCSSLDRKETFASIGLDSLKTAELEMALQEEYPSYEIPTGTLIKYPTVDDMDAYLLSCACNLNLKIDKDISAYLEPIPLSPQQRRLVFMSKFDPESSAQFNEPVVFSMKSESFEENKFMSVLNLIVMRHTILRTTYLCDSQVISSGTETFVARRELKITSREFVTQPIDIKCTSLHFAIDSTSDRIIVCLVFHHVAVDGFSISIIIEEMKALYSGAKLRAPNNQYIDYAKRTFHLLYKEELSKWREKLKDKEFQLLPTDRIRPATQTFNGSTVCKRLPTPLHKSLKNLRKMANCTDFCILVATYKFLIYKITGIDDFPIGFPLSLRDKQFSRTVGCFVNTLPLVERVDSFVTLADYLMNLSRNISEAKNMDVPFDLLVSKLKLERNDEVSPLFQVLLVMDVVDVPSSGDDIVFLDLPTRFSKYEQVWYFQYSQESLYIKVEYNSDLFFVDTINDILNRFIFILEQFESCPSNQQLKNIMLTTKSELNLIRAGRAANICDVPSATVLQMLLENKFSKGSINFEGKSMNYDELDQKSTQIAHEISRMYCAHYGEQPSPDRCGAVFMKRSFELIVVVLGLWKCGLQVVNFSLDWPAQRVLDILRLFENPILINFHFDQLTDLAKSDPYYPVLDKLSGKKQHGKLLNVTDVSDLAYITCTSGTTGKSKPVCTEFSGHCNLALAYTRRFLINSSSCTYQVVNYGFDIFFADLSKTFANGASMVLASELIPKIDEMQEVTNAYIMPAYLSSLSLSDIEQLDFLESVHFGGEAIQASTLQQLLRIDVHIYQEYGTTEQTVYTTANRMKVNTPIGEIGYPYSNLHLVSRDRDGQILPGKYRGMLYLNGLGISRGYYNMPAITSRTFDYGCFGKEFRTGDLIRCDHGRMYLMGRADLQIKIRGRIVDITEVHNKITMHPDVKACIVRVNGEAKVNELIAYVITNNTSTIFSENLTSFLSIRLPPYCIPKQYVFLDKFPLNQNGKIDKGRLPKPSRQSISEKLRPALGELEHKVVESFKKYTGKNHMANECFFEAGGDSVKDLMRQGLRLDLKSFFSLRTAEKIASVLQSQWDCSEETAKNKDLPRIPSYETPLLPQQKRMWFLAQLHPERDSYIIPINISMQGILKVKTLNQAFHMVLMVNPAMRSVILNNDNEPIFSRMSGTECFHELMQNQLQNPQIHDNSLIRAMLYKNGADYELRLRIHHIISDGRSLAIIGEELARAYNGEQLSMKEEIFDVQQQFDSMEFWKVYLADCEPLRIQTQGDSEVVEAVAGYLDDDFRFLHQLHIEEFCNTHGCTLYHVIMLAYVNTMRMTYGIDDFVVGTTVANRTTKNFNVVGLYVNTIPLRFNEEFADIQHQLRYTVNQIIAALEHQTTPLARIIEEVVKDRDVAKAPLFQHVITYESTSLPELPKMEGLVTKCLDSRTQFAQFDQSWIFHPGKSLSLTIQFDRSRYTMRHIQGLVQLFKRTLSNIFLHGTLCSVSKHTGTFLTNDTPRNNTLGKVFTRQAAMTSELLCLESKQGKLPYSKVLIEANTFAGHMQSAIWKHYGEAPLPDDIICIILRESTENHIVIEAVHILGCCYLCISQDTPPGRVSYILRDCCPRLVVSDLVHYTTTIPFLVPNFEGPERHFPDFHRASSDSLAYLIYTSGTTGTPKGVCINHQSVLNMLEHATRKYQFRAGVRVLQFTKSSFDASISNTFGALLNGGVLSVRDEEADVVEDLAARMPIAILHMTPIIMDIFEEDDLERLEDVEKWSFGGETLSEQTFRLMREKGKRLIQLYGPTEATCYQTLLDMKLGHESICLGPVIPNVFHGLCSFKSHHMHRHNIGQLFFSGENIARGYIGKSTAAFVPNPFRTKKDVVLERNIRVYLVGDEVMRDETGYLCFLGRRDDQIKLKGHRVQLSEIDTAAHRQNGVENAASVVQKDRSGASHIVLYYTGEKAQNEKIQKSLAQYLPKYMVPSMIIHLRKFPVTNNGKIDKAKLSERCDINNYDNSPADPKNNLEETVLRCYRNVLRKDNLNLSSDFFQSGGHSLLVVKLVSELEKSLKVTIPLIQVFNFPRVRDMVEYLRSSRGISVVDTGDCKLYPEERPTPTQITLLRSFRNTQLRAMYDIHLAITFKRNISPTKLKNVLNSLPMIHSALRSRFARARRTFLREILSGTECYQDLTKKFHHGLDPFQKPPFALSIDGNRLIMIVNHTIIDDNSMQLIVDSILQLLDHGQLPIDDGHLFHSWLLQEFERRKTEDDHYWRRVLQSFVFNQLPTTRPRFVKTNPEAASFEFKVSNLSSVISSWVSAYSCTPFIGLLTLFSRVLQSLSYDPRLPLSIGFPVNLRTQRHRNSVGYGINTVMIAQDSMGALPEVIRKTKQQVAEAISHAFLPFEEMAQLSPSKKLFSVMLLLDNYSIYENELFLVEPATPTVTKFELTIHVQLQQDIITIEYDKTLYDDDFLGSIAKSTKDVLSDWECPIQKIKCWPIQKCGNVYDVLDIQRLLNSIKVFNAHVLIAANNEIHLFCTTENNEEVIKEALMQLPFPLQPHKVTVEPENLFEFPLSTQQMQMYFLALQNPTAQILPFLKRFPKTVEASNVHRALLYAIQRHESLRTIFFEMEGELRQMVLSVTEAYVHLSIENSENLRRSVAQMCKQPLQLNNVPLLEAVLFESSDSYVALLRIHHIISDAWSTRILEQDLKETIKELERKAVPSIHRQKHTYREYCQIREETPCIDNEYVEGLLEAQDIPLIAPKGNEEKGNVKVNFFEFSQDIAHHLTVRTGVSIFVYFLDILARSVIEQFDLSSVNIGSPYANRSTKTKDVFGYFLNNIVFHIEKSHHDGNSRTLQIHANNVMKKNIPFTNLIAHVYKRTKAIRPLFQVYFNCRYDLEYNAEDLDEVLDLLPIKVEFPIEVDLDKQSDLYRVTFRIQDCILERTAKELVDRIRRKILGERLLPSQNLTLEEEIQPVGRVLKTVLEVAQKILTSGFINESDNFFTAGGNSLQVIAFAEALEEELDIDIDISDIYELRSFADLAMRLEEVSRMHDLNNATSKLELECKAQFSGISLQRCPKLPQQREPISFQHSNTTDFPSIDMSSLFKTLTMKYRTKIALSDTNNASITYLDVMHLLSTQAYSIRNLFAQVNGMTLIPDTIIPVLGRRSVATIIKCLSVVAAGGTYLPIDVHTPTARIRTLLEESRADCYIGSVISGVNSTPLELKYLPKKGGHKLKSCSIRGDLVYVIYTSGTTGTPKGACIKHEAVINMMMSATRDFRMRTDDVIYQFTNFVYDNSVLEIFMSFGNGAQLLVDTTPFSPRSFVCSIDKHCITHCLLFPGVVSTFRDENFMKLGKLRYWIVGAEKLPQEMLDRAVKYGINVIQNYGPTETTAYALTKHMRAMDEGANLGKTIQNTEVRVDEKGELWIRGVGIMRGYLNRNKSVVLQVHRQNYWYPSGDHVHLLPNNDVIFVGRKDNQVKIRGHRVELGEIESKICNIPLIKQCKVLWQQEQQVLLAFCISESRNRTLEREVLEECRMQLPQHMVPNQVLFVDEFPLTQNNKVDVDELFHKWELLKRISPRLEIASTILKYPVNPNLSLFENGGTTMQAIHIASMYYKEYGQILNVADMMRYPLICELENHSQRQLGKKSSERSCGVSDRLHKLWSKVLKHDCFTTSDNFFFVGGNSLLLIKLRYEINRDFHSDVGIQDLLNSLVFNDMVSMLCTTKSYLKTVSIIYDPPLPQYVLIFIHPLYGGSAVYVNLFRSLKELRNFRILAIQHPNSFGHNTDNPEFFESVQSLARRYAIEANEYIGGCTKVALIGASYGGTIAVEMTNYLSVTANVIVIDSGTDYGGLKHYSLSEHIESIDAALAIYDVDSEARFWMKVNSWDLLSLLSVYEPNMAKNLKTLHVFSTNGSDLGWGRFSPVTSTKTINGTHADMLSSNYSEELAEKIIFALEKKSF